MVCKDTAAVMKYPRVTSGESKFGRPYALTIFHEADILSPHDMPLP